MLFGYNTNGFAHHRLADTLMILAQLGYGSVAITLDHDCLDPFAVDLSKRIGRIKSLLQRFGLRCVIETGGRFLLDPFQKHQPTLISPRPEERQQRLDFLFTAVNIAREFGADAVSFWSGTPTDDAPSEVLMERLVEGCQALSSYAKNFEMRLAFEPEPGMFIDTLDIYARLWREVKHSNFGLTLDVGHLHCMGETPIMDQLQAWQEILWNVHIEDMRAGVHEHLMFGEGEIEFGPILKTLEAIGYTAGVHVELSRHSHDAVNSARRSLEFLREALE